MRVLVFGGREFNNKRLAFKALDQIHEKYGITFVIDGKARGADTLGNEWAIARGIPYKRFPADWAKYGNSAGPIRNREMAEEGKPEMGIAFPGGNGTYDMKQVLKSMGIKVLNVIPATMGK